ncbi:MAG TPA: LacI family DNA-binding transcriptional regulator [Polyangia bacterium]|nr:LacI family DNA-binding transcriptional regulator [Polyangia bacterium]
MQAARRRSTIIEVAARANVAFSTVSRVLNGGYASPEVRARVEQAARELNYTPSPIARNLKTGRQGCIGVVVESSQCSWFTQVLGGIEEALADKTVSALLGSLNLRGSYDASTIERWIADRRIDGLIFARCTRQEEGLVSQARQAQIPMVFIAPDENFAAGPVFVARNREAGRTLAEHLIALGHRRFAFLGGPQQSVDAIERLNGLREALAARELELDPANVQFGESFPAQGAAAYAEQWQAMPRASAPTAVVCANDTLAIEFLRVILQHGVRVPDEVSVVGFDGVPEGALYWPGLTTAKQPSQALGMAACRALMQMIDSPEAAEPERIDLPAELIVRESTGPAKGSAAKKPR